MTVGRILGNGKDMGSGFALATPHSKTTRVVLTAKHVVGDQELSSLQFLIENKRRIPVERVERDDELDIAVLHLREDVAEGLAVGRAVEEGSWQVETQPRDNDPKLTGTINAIHRPLVTQSGHAISVLQLQVDQLLDDYKGYSGSPVALKSPTGAVIGVLIEQLRSRLSLPTGQPKPATNILYAIPIQDVLDRFGLPYERIEPLIHVPFMCRDLPPNFVPRPKEFDALIRKLLDEQREEPVAISAALRGAGGYGKTTMAMALCHDMRIQDAFHDGILWVTLGEHPGNLVGKVEDLIYMLSHERPGFSGVDAAGARLAELLAERDILLVVDDVWDAMHLKPFLQGGTRCARLITTRNEDVLPTSVQSLVVDAMQSDEAMQLLGAGLEGAQRLSDERAFRLLSARLGEWPLLLKLVNGVLRERVSKNQPVLDALSYINDALDECGLTIFDARDAQDRSQAVAKTLSVSFQLLSEDEYTRYKELAIFPEDIDIPLSTVEKLWSMTGRLGKFKTEKLCEDLSRLSLVLNFDLRMRTIRVHDVIRGYLQHEVGPQLPSLHARLLDGYDCNRWAELPHDEPYLWDHLAKHLVGAQRSGELIATVKDLRYLASKTLVRSAYAVETDLAVAEQHAPEDIPLRLLKRHFVNMEHLLTRCTTLNDMTNALPCRLQHLPELSDLWQRSLAERLPPSMGLWHALPDLPHPALIRTLQGHTRMVSGCAVSPDGAWIVSASDDTTLKVWDAGSGEVRLTLRGHTDVVRGCAVSPDGAWIVSASDDTTLKVWDAHTGKVRLTLRGHTGEVSGCAVSPDGAWIVSASDGTLKVWDAHTGKVRLTLQGHTGEVTGCAVSPDGAWIVSASYDKTLKVWDAGSGICLMTFPVEGDLLACTFHPDGKHLVAAGVGGVYFLEWMP